MKNNALVITAVLLLLAVLVISRLYPFAEGFQTAPSSQRDVCGVLAKGKSDISTQLDQANSLINDANSQLVKIKASLDDVTKLSTSFSC
jgi:hypothetical protein